MAWPTHMVAAAGYVLDGKGNMLLIRTPHRGWDCTGGPVEVGEDVVSGVLREIMEESGVHARVDRLVGVYANVGMHLARDGVTEVPTKVMLDFLCTYEGGTLTAPDESLEVKWVPLDEVMNLITGPAQRFRFEKTMAFDGRVTYASYVAEPEFRLLSERTI